MPRSLELVVDSPASVGQVHSAFGDEDYWLARLAAFGGGTSLDSLVVDADGTVTVATTTDLRSAALPAVFAKVFASDPKILRRETWTPIEDRRVSGTVSVSTPGALLSGRADALLAPVDAGSRLSITGIVEVKVPLIGGRIESSLSVRLAGQIREAQRFTTVWISEHDRH